MDDLPGFSLQVNPETSPIALDNSLRKTQEAEFYHLAVPKLALYVNLDRFKGQRYIKRRSETLRHDYS
ncbi:hypothetical protein [Pseudanabaena sp. FACHB-2040]|uniref:hypothetical protein n=1 Tax=Pseudanabaena sp. FACHB-2040 TaxID=2692859 RepID=UPI00168916EA|nr:hypothetical protein [Pseudanabaena sp. FACHB-2040]MBD2255977.1 hypothetical protein [Pseudanabaena sp. FACHB-2040]